MCNPIHCIKKLYKILCKHNKKSTRCHIDNLRLSPLVRNISQLSLINCLCYCKAQQEASHNHAQVFISAKKMHVTVKSKAKERAGMLLSCSLHFVYIHLFLEHLLRGEHLLGLPEG